MRFVIKQKYRGDKIFPDLNDLLHEACRNPKAYAKMKRECEYIVQDAVRVQLGAWKPQGKCRLDIIYCEPNRGQRRDYDNIVGATRKIVCDALQKCGVIKNDNPDYLLYGSNEFTYGDEPYISVDIVECL